METVDPQLANTAVSTTVVSDVGIVVERAMYWPDISQGWQEAHNSFGVTETGLRWGVADGRIGGPRAHQTYILLANPNPVPAEVEVTFLKSGGTPCRARYTLAPTSRVNIWANGDVPELGEGTFSAEVRVLNYQPIAVEKALYWNAEGVRLGRRHERHGDPAAAAVAGRTWRGCLQPTGQCCDPLFAQTRVATLS